MSGENTSTGGGFWSSLNTLLTPSQETATQFAKAGPMLSIIGAVNGAISSYYSAKSQQYQLDSQASTMQFQSDLSRINAEVSEFQAQKILEAGERQIGAATMKYGQIKGQAKASMAARGIQLGEGSAKEVIATTDLNKQIDALTINANAVRAASAARTQSTNYANQSLLQGVSANNLSASSDTISPFSNVFTSLLGSATSVATSWYRDSRLLALEKKLGV